MTKYGKDYQQARARFKAQCQISNEACWICQGLLGDIDYLSRFDPRRTESLQFTLDHVRPVSLGGDMVSPSNMKPAHYVCNVRRGNTTRGQFPNSRTW